MKHYEKELEQYFMKPSPSTKNTDIILKTFNEHEKLDNKRHKEVHSMFKSIPTKEDIISIVGDTVDVKINGKLISLKSDNIDIKAHLIEQDKTLKEMNQKIQPLDGARAWVYILGKVIVYSGGIALALVGIYKFLQLIHAIK